MMASDFQAVPPEDRIYGDLIQIPMRGKAWRYRACREHVLRFVELSREVGDEGEFHFFLTDGSYCQICGGLELGLKVYMMNQVPSLSLLGDAKQ